jgi:hypothetical protein
VHNALLLVGIVVRDDGQSGFRNAEVEGLLISSTNGSCNLDCGYLRAQCRFEDGAFIGQICEEAADVSKSKTAVIGGAVRSRLE